MNKVTSKGSRKKLFSGNNHALLIVGDCAKAEHIVRFFDCSSGQYLYKKPLRVRNDLDGFQFLQKKAHIVLDKMGLKTKDVNFVLEDPASYSQDFIYYLQKEGFNVLYVNAFRASKFRENSRASNDNLDLDGIVRSALMGQTYKVDVMGSIYTRLKESHRERNRLVKVDNKHKSIIHSQIDQLFPGFLTQSKSGIQSFSKACVELMLCKNFGPQLFLKATSKLNFKTIKKAGFQEPVKVQLKLAELAAKCLNLTEDEPNVINMRRQRLQKQLQLFKVRHECIEYEEQVMASLLQNTPYALFTSITGAGIVTVSAIAGEMGDPLSWPNSDKTASYAGIVPRQKQSGGSQKQAVITTPPKAANKYLKNAIMTIVRVAKKYEHPSYRNTGIPHPLKAHFEKVSLRGGSSYTATAKKLVRIMTAMLRDETIYLPDTNEASPQSYALWLEAGTAQMLEKWSKAGIQPTDENYLGKWLKNKDNIIALIKK